MISSHTPVLVDFYAPKCSLCQMMQPILEQVKTEIGHELLVVSINTEKYPNLAAAYGIQELPTLILLQDADPVLRIKGIMPAASLIQHLQMYLGYSGRQENANFPPKQISLGS